jgi:hypothetical protein
VVQENSAPQSGVMLREEDTLAEFGFNGRITLSGNVILHTLQNPLVPENYEGLFFEDANGNTVACIDTDGNLHTIKPVLVNVALEIEPEELD